MFRQGQVSQQVGAPTSMFANSTEDTLLSSNKPEVDVLNAELYRSYADRRVNNRVREADEVRYAYWHGQTQDGRKHTKNVGRQVHPWEGASDSRILLADEYCDFYVSLLDGADARSVLNVNPVEYSDSENASAIQTYMSWLLTTWLSPKWEDEMELVKQYSAQYGWAGVHVKWNKSYQNSPLVLSLESLGKFLGVSGDASSSSLPAVLGQHSDLVGDILAAQMPHLKRGEISKRLKELRTNGKTTIEMPKVVANHPEIIALKPFYELLFPPETRDIQRARVLFRRDSYSWSEVDDMVGSGVWSEEWAGKLADAAADPKKWADNVKRTSGQHQQWWDRGVSPVQRTTDSVNDSQNMVEIVHAYSRRVDENGVPGVYQTVFSPYYTQDDEGKEAFASHALVTEAGGKYPINVFTREKTTREVIESRGIPDIANTWQSEYKAQIDMLFDRSNLETLPPLKVPQRYGNRISIGPGKQLSEQRPGDISWMEPPRKGPDVALKNIEQIELRGDRYFGRPNPALDPTAGQIRQQAQVNRWLRFKGLVVRDIWELVQTFGSDDEFGSVTGTGNGIPRDKQKYNFSISYDIRELDSEFTQKKLDAVSKVVVPADVMGVLDRRKLVEAMLRAIDPTMPQELMVSDAEASQAMFNDVRNEVAQMALGNQPNFVENDPAAQVKMQFAQQIIQANPNYQEMLSKGERFAQLMELYMKNLGMSVQQAQNAQTGRLGVSPNDAGG